MEHMHILLARCSSACCTTRAHDWRSPDYSAVGRWDNIRGYVVHNLRGHTHLLYQVTAQHYIKMNRPSRARSAAGYRETYPLPGANPVTLLGTLSKNIANCSSIRSAAAHPLLSPFGYQIPS